MGGGGKSLTGIHFSDGSLVTSQKSGIVARTSIANWVKSNKQEETEKSSDTFTVNDSLWQQLHGPLQHDLASEKRLTDFNSLPQ
jgi:hypothetical protein